MAMDMVKVDPKLFVTCRLCLENMGMYQITPIVQQQIKYCFDIEVDPFDGLPQLICPSCETILSEYHTKKKIFIGRQNALKARLEVRREVEEESHVQDCAVTSPQQDAVSSSQQNHSEISEISPEQQTRPKNRMSRIVSTSSSSDAECEESPSVVMNKKKYIKKNKKPVEPWKTDYNKKFSCKLCGRHLKSKTNFWKHMKKHSNLISKYKEIINKPCILSVTKIDGKANKTGSSNAVVISSDKIIGPERDNTYNIIYFAKEENRSNGIPTDTDDVRIQARPAKRRRLLSGSSTDTVVLAGDNSRVLSLDKDENKSMLKLAVNKGTLECINIDDSSNSSSTSLTIDTDHIQIQEVDKKAIDNLIKLSHSRYILRKHETLDNESRQKDLPMIKHKILSMGRKVIHKQGLACTGLLRFIERQNLEIKWIPTDPSSENNDGNFVRIMPRLRGKEEFREERAGWKYIIYPTENNKGSHNSINHTKSNKKYNKNAVVMSKPIKVKTIKEKPEEPQLNVQTIQKNSQPEVSLNETEPEVVYHIPESDKKLLNANPVANPKQLPKKLNLAETTIFVQPVAVSNAITIQNSSQNSQSICVDLNTHPDNETCMPVITSTTSLAVPSLEKNEDNRVKSENISNKLNAVEEKPAPRIKVKPFTELMSERALQIFGQKQDTPSGGVSKSGGQIAPANKDNPNQLATITKVSNAVPLPIRSITSTPAPTTPQPQNRVLVMLDTVELPNTTTDSPFRYVKNLLQIHNIVLLDSNKPVPPNFACLIKFKLMFLRETVDTPVTLSLSVYCAGNTFCLGVKDSYQVNTIDLGKLSATWQWEILKTFVTRSDIIQKLSQNAQKISREAHEHTQAFLCLLKSIKYTAIS